MKTQIGIGICILCAGAFLKVLSSVNTLLVDLDKSANQITTTTKEVQDSTKALRTEAYRVLVVVGGTATTVEKASKAQRQYWEQYGKQVADDLNRLNAMIEHTDKALNDGVLPAAQSSLVQSVDSQKALVASIDGVQKSVTPILVKLAETADRSNQILADVAPELNKSAESMAQTMEHANGSMQHVEQTTAYLQDYAKRLTSPGKEAWNAILAIGHFVSAFGPALGRIF